MKTKVTTPLMVVAILLSSLCFSKGVKAQSQSQKTIVGYFPNWKWYRRNHVVNPKTIQYSKYTHINYSFFIPTTSGKIVESDAWADENLLLGEPDWQNGGYKANTNIIDLAHNAGTKVIMAVGGWNHSPLFPAIAKDDSKRALMVSSIIDLVKKYRFDGVDMDWEYPGFADHNGSPADTDNFTKLIRELRAALTDLGKDTGKTYLLTSAFSTDIEKMKSIDWDAVVPLLDMINVMTYDYFGAWDNTTNHNAPLYASGQGNPNFNINSSYKYLVDTYHIPSSKVNIGVAFYGRAQSGVSTLFSGGAKQVDQETFPEDEGAPSYYNIMKRINQYTRHWDDQAKVPYLTKSNGFVSYDDPESIGYKAQYVMDNNIGGVIIWEITCDYMETSEGSGKIGATPLIDKLHQVFDQTTGVSDIFKVTENGNLSIYPNPSSTKGFITILFDANENTDASINIYNSTGQKVVDAENIRITKGKNTIPISIDKAGIYILNIRAGKESIQEKLVVR
ncbi:MAG: glycosyl hydrolase family 18 protein [Hyphomicrobiales bacterium]